MVRLGAIRKLLRGQRDGPSSKSVFRWVLTTVVLYSTAAGLQILKASREAASGEVALRSLTVVENPVDMDVAVVSAALTIGRHDLESASDRMSSLIVRPLHHLPFFGRQIRSADALVSATAAVAAELDPMVKQVWLAKENPDAVDRVAFLEDLTLRLGRLENVLQQTHLGPSENLVSDLSEARYELGIELDDLSDRAEQYGYMTLGLASFLDGGNYLMLAANNAEMSLGSGMHLSVGRLVTADGGFSIEGLTQTSDYEHIDGASVIDQDVRDRWGFLDVATDFRKLGISGRFDEFVGPQALEMWKAETSEQLDGVAVLDPFVLEALLEVIGPVEVEGQMVASEDVLGYLLREQYEAFGTDIDKAETDIRHNWLSLLAVAAADAFEERSWDPLELVRALGPVAEGRHLLMFSTNSDEQNAWHELGVSGSLSGDELGVFWLNTGASKLDPFVSVDVVAESEIVDDHRSVSMVVTSRNAAPGGLSEAVVGPWKSLGLAEKGDYVGRLAFYLPRGASNIEVVSGEEVDVAGPDGPATVLSTRQLVLSPGETRQTQIRFSLPVERSSIKILPSARYPAEQWEWDGVSFDDSVLRTVELVSE